MRRALLWALLPAAALLLAGGTGTAHGGEEKGIPAAVEGNTAFAVDLFKKLKSKPGNLFFSPYSISSALAMTYAGARRKTESEMAEVLHFTLGQKGLHRAMGGLTEDFNGRALKSRYRDDPDAGKKPFELVVANALWSQKGYAFEQSFFDLNLKWYGAGLRELDFLHETEKARLTINGWVAKKTKDRILDLIPPNVLAPATCLVLTNAIYFKSSWSKPFRERATREAPFHLESGKTVSIPFMHKMERGEYMEGETFLAVSLPYAGKDLSMIILLPKKADGLAELEDGLSTETLEKWLGGMKHATVDLALPKFEVTSEFSLKETLPAMGMKEAFTPRRADFTGISPTGELYISEVLHKAFVKVDEKGTEAAAATAVLMKRTGRPRADTTLKIDRPFLFLIRDAKTGSLLFVGRVADPRD